MLVNGTREKAPAVRSSSEIALVNLLRLKQENSIYDVKIKKNTKFFNFCFKKNLILKETLSILDSMKESFEDCVKSLSKESFNPQAANIDELSIDETLLKLDS